MVRHSSEDAPNDGEFERLYEAASTLSHPYDVEAAFVVIAGGRLGMRAGEIAHITEEWVDWEKEQIHIPSHDRCTYGSGDDICGYCRYRAQEATEHNEDLTLDEALAQRWQPKTSNSARAIPFGFNTRVSAVVEAFFDQHDSWPKSRVAVNRRVDRAADAAGLHGLYPHCLRAHAATFHAYRGVPAVALQSLFGWANLDVAQKYIRLSGGATAQALEDAHAD